MYDDAIITKKEYDFKADAATYDVEINDRKSLDGSLFVAKNEILKIKKGFKYYISTRVSVKKWNSSTESNVYDVIYGCSNPIEVTNQRFYLNKAYKRIKHVIENFFNKGSGWMFDEIRDIWIRRSKYDPLAASSFIPLPEELNNSMKRVINITNQGKDDCFKCCHVRLINPRKSHPERVTSKRDKETIASLDYSGIDFPLKAKDHELVEERFNIIVNIFGYNNDNKKVHPLCISRKSNQQKLNVLLISNGEKNHYVFIKDAEKLLSAQLRTKNIFGKVKSIFVFHVYKILQEKMY